MDVPKALNVAADRTATGSTASSDTGTGIEMDWASHRVNDRAPQNLGGGGKPLEVGRGCATAINLF